MNKRYAPVTEEDKFDAHKRHRKHKHKSKHKKHGIRIPVFSSGSAVALHSMMGNDDDDDEDDGEVIGDDDQPQQDSDGELVCVDGIGAPSTPRQQQQTAAAGVSSGLKLKFKFGGQTLGETSVAIVHETDEENQLIEVVDDVPPAVASDISDEDAWLDALESGKLDEYDEMRRMKDPALMTARQKALLESKSQLRQHPGQLQPEYLMLPLGYKEKEMTEEMIQKRELKAKKRRQMAQEKREKDKIETIDRLLKKQEAKPKGNKARSHKKSALEVPKFTYINNKDGCAISVPIGYSFAMQPSKIDDCDGQQRPTVIRCGVPHCTNPKRYSCSKTGVPLCSLECYKTNLSTRS